jgi:hypothetical protein
MKKVPIAFFKPNDITFKKLISNVIIVIVFNILLNNLDLRKGLGH